jgi:hypothetical protein
MLVDWHSGLSEQHDSDAILAARAIFDRAPDARLRAAAKYMVGWVTGCRLFVGSLGALVPEDVFIYATPILAVEALEKWDPLRASAPAGWVYHPETGRVRINGEAKREFGP